MSRDPGKHVIARSRPTDIGIARDIFRHQAIEFSHSADQVSKRATQGGQ
jgi:hypothetical protein